MSKRRSWFFSHNTFNTATRNNLTLAEKLISLHIAGLIAEALIDASVAARVITFQLVSSAFHTEFVKHIQFVNSGASATKTLNDLFELLGKTKSKKWTRSVEDVYEVGTDGYKRLLNKGRKVLYASTFINRIAYLDAFALALADEAAPLDAVLAEVEPFIVDLKAALQNQKNAQENLKASSARLEPLRVAAMKAMFSNLGFFIEKYPDSPKDIERTFDLTSIRRFTPEAAQEAEEYIVEIEAGHQTEAGISLTPTMKLLFVNLTSLPLKIFLSGSNDPDQEVTESYYLLEAEAQVELFISQIGNPNLRYMFILNENSTENAEVSIMIIN